MAGLAFGLTAAFLAPGLVSAHPLGNFTINHYAGVRIEPERILLDVVIDEAEIPTFQARLRFDTDGDGELSDAETDSGRVASCEELAGFLELQVDGQPVALELVEAGLIFPPGAGGLETMRSVCGFGAALGAPIVDERHVAFADRSFPGRLGWREIVVEGSEVGLTATGSGVLRSSSVSARLTSYPADLLTQALADTAIEVLAAPGRAALPPLDIPDARPVAVSGSVAAGGAPGAADPSVAPSAAIPGGIGATDLPAIFRVTELTPVVLLLSLLTAAALGAGHALTPGHGKTLMAAYLVGTRGTPAHAAGLGLSVALSHTLGILVLSALVTGAQGLLPPDVVVRTAPIVAAVSIVAIGGWMLYGEARRRFGRHDHARHDHLDQADHLRPHPHPHENDDHEHDHDPMTGEHRHGRVPHSHLPAQGASISWRSLFVLGLAGGLIPSASALLILLGSIAASRPAFGLVLVFAFGVGMALVMTGIGLALVLARGRLDRADASTWLGRAGAHLPLAASVVVLGFGVYLTVQAASGAPAL